MNSEKIKCLIIDDDPFILELLQDKLSQHFPEVEVLATASSGHEGLKKIALYYSTQNIADRMLILKTQDGDLKLILKDIIHIEGDRNYSYIHLKNTTSMFTM